MTQTDLARAFSALHVPGTPLILYNAWDAGSAKAVTKAGARAIATGSWSLAAAQGYGDGQQLPLEFALQILGRICASVNLPVTFDFEAGFASSPSELATNAERVLAAGAIGINFEDRYIGTPGLLPAKDQAERIATIRQIAEMTGVPLFINARTDVFFQGSAPTEHPALLDEALERAAIYAEAGANGLFVPGLITKDLIGQICEASPLPVNIMQIGTAPDSKTLSDLGVARISYGPSPYLAAMDTVTTAAKAAFAG